MTQNLQSLAAKNFFLWCIHAKMALPFRMTETSTSHVKLHELT